MPHSNQEQLEHVSSVLELLGQNSSLDQLIRTQKRSRYPVPEPKQPELRQVTKPKYPEPDVPWIDTSDKKALGKTIGMSLLMSTFGIGYLIDRSNRKDKAKQTPEYQQIVANLDAKYAQECEAAQREYTEASVKYRSDLTEYSKNKAEWEQKQAKKIVDLEFCRKRNDAEIRRLIEKYKLIPEYYANYEALNDLYTYMNDTNCSLNEAIQWYDRRDLVREQQRLVEEQQRANQIYEDHLAAERNREFYLEERRVAAMEAQADAIADVAHTQKVYGTINVVQEHNRNKMLKKMLNK